MPRSKKSGAKAPQQSGTKRTSPNVRGGVQVVRNLGSAREARRAKRSCTRCATGTSKAFRIAKAIDADGTVTRTVESSSLAKANAGKSILCERCAAKRFRELVRHDMRSPAGSGNASLEGASTKAAKSATKAESAAKKATKATAAKPAARKRSGRSKSATSGPKAPGAAGRKARQAAAAKAASK